MSADWSTPALATAYADFLADLKARDVDAITLCTVDPTNIPTGAIKYLRASNKFQEWDGAAWQDKVIALAGGGTGASTAATARTALGLGSISVQDANAVAITGGTLAGVTAPASIITSGLMAQARLGTGSGGTGTLFLADDQTYKPGIPVGFGGLWYTDVAPTGYLICDGSSVLRATYAALFALIGTTYGSVDGTHFNLPDLRQRFPLGKAASGTGSSLAGTGGAIDHTHTGPSHTHTYTDIVNHTHPVNITDPGHTHDGHNISGASGFRSPSGDWTFGTGTADEPNAVASNTTGITATTSNPGGAGASGTTAAGGTGNTGGNNPPYLVINYIIKT